METKLEELNAPTLELNIKNNDNYNLNKLESWEEPNIIYSDKYRILEPILLLQINNKIYLKGKIEILTEDIIIDIFAFNKLKNMSISGLLYFSNSSFMSNSEGVFSLINKNNLTELEFKDEILNFDNIN